MATKRDTLEAMQAGPHAPPRSAPPRRAFLARLAAGGAALLAALAGWPLWHRWLGLADLELPPSAEHYTDLGPVEGFPPGLPAAVSLALPGVPAYARPTVYVTRSAESDFLVFSAVCPHLSCPVGFRAAEDRYRCGCHDSSFDRQGRRQGGPAPRDLDPLPWRVEANRLLVQWKRYTPNTPERLEG